jgi:hypothetical protein
VAALLCPFAPAVPATIPTGNTFPNGVSVTNACGGPKPDSTIVFSQSTTADTYHPFLGYGVNLQQPLDEATALKAIPDIQGLNFKFVKTEMGTPYVGDAWSTWQILPAPMGLPDDDAMYAAIHGPVEGFYAPYTLTFMQGLRAAGIRWVATSFGAPNSYVTTDGLGNEWIVDANIPDYTQFYPAYLRSLQDLGLVPDYDETQNEPNGAWSTKWSTDQFAQMMTALQHDVYYVDTAAPANPVASGTATWVHFAMDYLDAIQAQAATWIDPNTGLPYPKVGLGGLKALTLHTYYVIQDPTNGGVPPADDPDFHAFYEQARAAGLPLIVTEFGGTTYKAKSTDPQLENVNPAEELKAALDLARNGAGAALVWNLYPNTKDGVTYRTWALIDDVGPTNAYWPFAALAPNIPDGSAVLSLQKSTVKAKIDSLGYAAFQDGNVVVVGLANPSAAALLVSMDVATAPDFLVTKLDSFTPTGLMESVPHGLVRTKCAMSVQLPGDPGAAALGTGVVISMLLKPTITTQPAPFTQVPAGTPVTLSVGATLDPGIAFQWKKGGKLVKSATSASLTFTASGASGSEQSYTVTVSNAAGKVTSNAAVVQIQ